MHPEMRQREDELAREDGLARNEDLRHDEPGPDNDDRAPDLGEHASDMAERREQDMSVEHAPDQDGREQDMSAQRAPDRSAADAPSFELFEPDDVDRFRSGWRDVQTRFVDDPREAVEGADRLVADVMRSLTTRFADCKHELEGRWQEGSEAETEDLRQALRSYRSFFDRLLNV